MITFEVIKPKGRDPYLRFPNLEQYSPAVLLQVALVDLNCDVENFFRGKNDAFFLKPYFKKDEDKIHFYERLKNENNH